MHLNSLRNNKYWNKLPQKIKEKIKNKFKETKSEIGVAVLEGLKTIVERITIEPFLFYTTLYFACQMRIGKEVWFDDKLGMYGCQGNMFDEMINFCFYVNYYLDDLSKIDWDRIDWLYNDTREITKEEIEEIPYEYIPITPLEDDFINALDDFKENNLQRNRILNTYVAIWEDKFKIGDIVCFKSKDTNELIDCRILDLKLVNGVKYAAITDVNSKTLFEVEFNRLISY